MQNAGSLASFRSRAETIRNSVFHFIKKDDTSGDARTEKQSVNPGSPSTTNTKKRRPKGSNSRPFSAKQQNK